MEHLFLPYELAVKLKEIGFDEMCLGCYTSDGNFILSKSQHFKNTDSSVKVTDSTCAPIWDQVFNWFRNNNGFITHFDWYWDNMKEKTIKWEYSIRYTLDKYLQFEDGKYGFYDGELKEFKTYEEARLACLEKLIEIVFKS